MRGPTRSWCGHGTAARIRSILASRCRCSRRRFLLSSFPLNPQQRDAVRYCDGPLLVLAGAGSGKTRVIAAKIAHLVDRGVDPAQIIAITFTNKAAREMRERAQTLLARQDRADAVSKLVICTFHAFGLMLLRREAKAAGLHPGFSILDPGDLEGIVAELVATADRARARAAQWRISAWKNALVSPAAALAQAASDDEQVAARAYAHYDDTLAAYRAVDFDDLIVRPLALLDADAEVAGRWQDRCAHVLVDEYQDTNPAQYRLLRALVGARTPFTAVGDDDQAIYGWRGATLDNLAQLPRDYPQLKVVKLEQNYRSTVRILRSANALIGNNRKLYAKKLWSDLGHGEPIRVAPMGDDETEAQRVVDRIAGMKFERRAAYGDFAILYRGNHQAQAFETALRARGIAYEISGGQSIFERSEIKDIVAYLRLIANDDDDPAFLRAVAAPRRGVGRTTLARLADVAAQRHESLFAATFSPEVAQAVPARQRDSLVEFCGLVNDLRYRAEREPAGRLLDELLARSGYEAWLVDTLDKRDAQARTKSVREFTDWLARKGEADARNLVELTQMVALVTMLDGRDSDRVDAVRLSTIHAAKGLEFPHVFVVGLEEGILPHREAVAADDVEEERRLMYVALTRARQSLHLSWCRTRRRAGERVAGQPSRFIGELAQEDLRYADAPRTAEEATAEKAAGAARLASLRAMLSQ
ncbi:MAG: UvrD-helicase domain-containing protein [Burkholderiales bacterium]|nr:UvrD-helicase domain-containing protein [Burkholderiales bacterium]